MQRGYWPSGYELRQRGYRIGCSSTVQATLAKLRDHGLLNLVGATANARWEITTAGFELIHHPPLKLDYESRTARRSGQARKTKAKRNARRRVDAAQALSLAHSIKIPVATTVARGKSSQTAAAKNQAKDESSLIAWE